MFEVDPSSVQLDYVGLNHLTWERKVLVDGEDRLPALLDALEDPDSPAQAYRRELEAETHLDLVQALRAIPSYYLHYYYDVDRVLAAQQAGETSRAEEVMKIEAELLELYRDPTLDTKPKLLEERGGAFYSDAAAALVASLHAGTGRRAGREPAQRRRHREPARRCRGGDLGHDRSRGRPPDRHRRARAGHARPGGAREGL